MKMYAVILIVVLIVTIGITVNVHNIMSVEQTSIPNWLKNTAKLWGEGQTSDSEFINAIQWLVDQKILVIQSKPESAVNQLQNPQTITSIQDLLPKQNDIGNEWEPSKITTDKNSYNDTIHYDNTVVTQNFTQVNTSDKILVVLYEFGSPDKAMKWDNQLTSTMQGAGYSIGPSVDGSIQDLCQMEDTTNSIPYYTSILMCHHGDFQFTIMGTNNTNSKQDMNKFAEIILNKIWLITNVNR